MTLPRVLCAAWLGLTLAACGARSYDGGGGSGNASGNDGATAGPVSEAQFLDQAPPLMCAQLQDCCMQAGFEPSPLLCSTLSAGAQRPPGATFDAEAAGACLSQLRQGDCTPMAGSSPCDGVFTGSLALGDSCTDDSECAPAATGQTSCDLFDEVCIVTRRGVAGDPCSESCQVQDEVVETCSGSGASPELGPYERVQCHLEDGVVCGGDHVCQPLSGVGEACQSSVECEARHYCDVSGGAGVCAPWLALGAACEAFTTSCGDDAFCNAAGTCEALKPEGAACMGFDECQGSCDAGICTAAGGDLAAGLLGLVCAGGLIGL